MSTSSASSLLEGNLLSPESEERDEMATLRGLAEARRENKAV